jgi:four helix bundle protein
MDKKFLKLNDLNSYNIAFNLSNFFWEVVVKWEWFAKKHLGGQFIEAVDSISANIAEGFGRYHKKDKIKFYRYSQGSLLESIDWNEKSKARRLLTDEHYQHIHNELQKLPLELNQLIKYTNEKLTV